MAAFLERRRLIGGPSRLTADVDPRNLRSIKLLEKHGFVETGRANGTWQVGNELCDSVYLALDL
jgi:RimJ/RimL family protein N-acetyltransferase